LKKHALPLPVRLLIAITLLMAVILGVVGVATYLHARRKVEAQMPDALRTMRLTRPSIGMDDLIDWLWIGN
jgi:hypothetical protein